MPRPQSTLVLVAANLLPLVGVVWLDWPIKEFMILYWLELMMIVVLAVTRLVILWYTLICPEHHRPPGVRSVTAIAALLQLDPARFASFWEAQLPAMYCDPRPLREYIAEYLDLAGQANVVVDSVAAVAELLPAIDTPGQVGRLTGGRSQRAKARG